MKKVIILILMAFPIIVNAQIKLKYTNPDEKSRRLKLDNVSPEYIYYHYKGRDNTVVTDDGETFISGKYDSIRVTYTREYSQVEPKRLKISCFKNGSKTQIDVRVLQIETESPTLGSNLLTKKIKGISSNGIEVKVMTAPDKFFLKSEGFEIYFPKSTKHKKHDSSDDKNITNDNSPYVKLKKENGVYKIPVTLNNTLKVNFIFDTGASEILISREVFIILQNNNSITEKDRLEDGIFIVADGYTIKLKRYLIKEIQIGNKVIYNIPCAVSDEIGQEMLLGQSLLEKCGSYFFDYTNLELKFEK